MLINLLLFISIFFILLFSFTNGMKDGSNVFATAVASKSISKRNAIIIVCISEFLGPFLLGIPVAVTVAKGIINIDLLSHDVNSMLLVLSGITGAIILNFFTWFFKMPTSSSFALVGGLIGPVLFVFGKDAVPWKIFFYKVIGALFLSAFLGILIGYFVFQIFLLLLNDVSIKANNNIKNFQILTLILLGINHGTNDSQKAMGVISLLLYIAGKNNIITVPFWVILVSALTLMLGITMGGDRIIKTVGFGIFKLKPIHSLTSQISAFSILLTSNIFGAPVSTTQIINSSVIGVGTAFRKKTVRWIIIKEIIWSWILTIPLTAIISVLIYLILSHLI